VSVGAPVNPVDDICDIVDDICDIVARDTERAGVQGEFIIRRPWVTQGIQVPTGGKATRDKLEAELVLEPSRDFLARFERGGAKTPRSGRDLAIAESARPTPQSLMRS
jgi:hypothetical protein